MSSNDRITRPSLPRREPERAWSGVRPGGLAGAGDIVSRAVDLGYRVVDEYIRQGQRAAEQLGARTPMAAVMGPDVQEIAVRMAQYTSEAFTMWLQLMNATVAPNGHRAPPPAMPGGWDSVATPAASAARAIRVRVDVAEPVAVEATVELTAESAGRALTAQALRAADPAKPRLTDVRLLGADGDEPPTLVVRLPPGIPPDLYSGIVVDAETGRLAGTVAVRVLERAP